MKNHSRSNSLGNTSLSPQERKSVLINNLNKTQKLHENINNDTVHMLQQVVEDTDNINLETNLDEKINNQEEIVLDSRMMNEASKVLHDCSKALTKDISPYNYKEFAAKLKHYVQNYPDTSMDNLDWSVLDAPIVKLFNQTGKHTTLLGTLVPLEKKEIAKRKRTAKDAFTTVKRPDNIVSVEKDEESLENTVKRIRKLVLSYYKENQEQLDFFKLILDPTDFGRTIENMLHVAFLVKDGLLKVTKDESGALLVLPCNKEMAATARHSENIQNVLSLNIHQWQLLTKRYKLREPMIVHGFA